MVVEAMAVFEDVMTTAMLMMTVRIFIISLGFVVDESLDNVVPSDDYYYLPDLNVTDRE